MLCNNFTKTTFYEIIKYDTSVASLMKKISIFACFLIMFTIPAVLLPSACLADTSQEISHLLTFMENSGCRFFRNGTAYSAAEAREHIQTKYDYVRRRIKTTEDFIEYTATKSSMSGRKYKVQCGDREMLSAEWLKAELVRFRENR